MQRGVIDQKARRLVKPVIVVAAGSFDETGLEAAFGEQAELRFAPMGTAAEVMEASAGADALVVTLQPLRREHIAAMDPRVKVIGRAGVGLDTLDLDAAREADITVLNQPTYGIVEVASHALAMFLALHRRLRVVDSYVRNGWQGPVPLQHIDPVDEMTVGLVGCGRIGVALATMLGPIVGSVIAYDPFVHEFPAGVEEEPSLGALLARSHAVSLHVPLGAETRGILSDERLAGMHPGALVVNVARGGLIDEVALADALVEGSVGGVALDVFEAEPLPLDSPLRRAPNTLFSPHVAAYSERSSWRLASWTLADALSWITSREVRHGNIVVKGAR